MLCSPWRAAAVGRDALTSQSRGVLVLDCTQPFPELADLLQALFNARLKSLFTSRDHCKLAGLADLDRPTLLIIIQRQEPFGPGRVQGL